jgi:O-antigen ligase
VAGGLAMSATRTWSDGDVEPPTLPRAPLERAACLALLAFAALLQVSIAAADILLTVVLILWAAIVIGNRERITVPRMFWPLLAYGAWMIVSAIFSVDVAVSLIKCKQLILLAIVPLTYRLLRGPRATLAVDVVISIGALSATYGIIQYLILNYDVLGRRPQGALGHYMTYSGLLMLVTCSAVARVMFASRRRTWAALVLPALLLALAFTFTRSAWVGACVGIGILFLLRDFRLLGLLPIAIGAFLIIAPSHLTARLYSTFDLKDPSNADRVAMLHSGLHIIKDNPLTGVGPDMIIRVYPHYRDKTAINQLNPHLHNVPLQIAAERGLPALVLWLWFIVVLVQELWRRRSPTAALANGALAIVGAMLAAGLFEYNFGDSEFLMLFLMLITLPFAAAAPLVAAAPDVQRLR